MQRQAPGHVALMVTHLLTIIMLYKDKLVGHNSHTREITPLKLVSTLLVKEQLTPLSVVLCLFYLSEMMQSKWRYVKAYASVVYL